MVSGAFGGLDWSGGRVGFYVSIEAQCMGGGQQACSDGGPRLGWGVPIGG